MDCHLGKIDLVIYILVRSDLKMGKGKIGGQCGHAVQGLLLQCPKPLFITYNNYSSTKIVVKVSDDEELNQFTVLCRDKGLPYCLVTDAGKTQVDPGTKTVLGIGPISRESVPPKIRELKLL